MTPGASGIMPCAPNRKGPKCLKPQLSLVPS